jgi:hypothetical protein
MTPLNYVRVADRPKDGSGAAAVTAEDDGLPF